MEKGYASESTRKREMEKLDRGLTAVKTSDGVYLSWRLWDSEDMRYGGALEDVSFNIYRNDESNTDKSAAEDLAYATLTVTDADGQTVGTASEFPLRNFSKKRKYITNKRGAGL